VVFSEEDLMVHRHVSRKDPAADAAVAPAYTQRLDLEPIPKYRMPERGAAPEAVYRLIHDELLLDGSSRLNLGHVRDDVDGARGWSLDG
jgi:glutamate decarboxylase